MNAQEITAREDFKRCADFHGHVCPGLSIGYKAAKAAMARLKEDRSEDEEMVAVVETDACSADAVQVLTGCTFGKGNLVFKDYGKMVLTLYSRNTGKGVRVAMRPGAQPADPTHMALLQKVMGGEANEKEKQRFREMHLKRSHHVLETPDHELFTIKEVRMPLPEKAKIEMSEPCSRCGEPTMRSKLTQVGEEMVCGECFRN